MKNSVELNSLLLKLFRYINWFDEDETGGLSSDAYFSNPIICLKL